MYGGPGPPLEKGSSVHPRRRRSVPRHGLRGATRSRGLLAAAAAVAGAMLVAVLASGGTYALWSDSAPLGAGTIRTGDAELSLSTQNVSAQNLLPGEVHSEQLSIHNTGGVPLDVSASADAVSPHFAVRLQIDPAQCAPGAPLSAPELTASPSAPVPVGSIAAGATGVLCVQVTALAGVLPSETAAYAVSLVGTQAS